MLMCVQDQDLSRTKKKGDGTGFHRKDVKNANIQLSVNPYTGSLDIFPLILESSAFIGAIHPQ